MKLSLKDLREIFPKFNGQADHEIYIEEVFIDSRKKANKGLFVPIIGERFNGHMFLKDAIYQGAIAALWQKDQKVPDYVPNDFPLFFVENTVKSLQMLANDYKNKVNPIVIGVTGSNGKTTTKDLVASVVMKQFKVYKTKGNFNNHIGLPLTILSMDTNTEVLILEMGMNHFGEISQLSKVAEPDYAIITNIGESHIEHLGSREGITNAKLEIIDGLKENGKLIIDGDEPLLTNKKLDVPIIKCGIDQENDLQISDIKTTDGQLTFSVRGISENFSLSTLGSHNAKNALYAIAIGKELAIPIKKIKEGLHKVTFTGMRLEQFTGKNDSLLINDAYNASPTSMKAAIHTIKNLKQYKEKVLVLGDMHELGKSEEALHRQVAKAITAPITDVITVGPKAKWISDELKKFSPEINVYHFDEKEDVISCIESKLSKDTVVLFKASRAEKFESIVSKLVI